MKCHKVKQITWAEYYRKRHRNNIGTDCCKDCLQIKAKEGIYEKYGTSPTGGCLGSLIQLPFLFALWTVVQNVPAYVNGLKEAYNKFNLIDQIKATEGYQKILENFTV